MSQFSFISQGLSFGVGFKFDEGGLHHGFRTFAARRETPKKILTDNGTNFIGARNVSLET